MKITWPKTDKEIKEAVQAARNATPVPRSARKIIRHIIRILLTMTSGVTMASIIEPNRTVPVKIVRHVLMFIACRHFNLAAAAVGRAIDRDHATVLHGIETVEQKPERYEPLLTSALKIFAPSTEQKAPPPRRLPNRQLHSVHGVG